MFVVLLLVAGCGGGAVPVKGIVQMNGSPIELADKESIILTWHWIDKEGIPRATMAKTDHDGSFVVPGPTGKGLLPDDYKIGVKIDMLRDQEEPKTQQERLLGDFSPEKTPLRCTITAGGENDLVIDVGTKTVTRR